MHGVFTQQVPQDISDKEITCQHHKEERAEYEEKLEIIPLLFHFAVSTTLRCQY
ncbi:hypothetical protein FACS189494_10600 [Spirochaetia bacterium]|nr:hypothetical protein FACS189494_10600 [Spirochaetia bacterium]